MDEGLGGSIGRGDSDTKVGAIVNGQKDVMVVVGCLGQGPRTLRPHMVVSLGGGMDWS